MKILCLFANEYPYGTWEPFLETETKYYDSFDQVYIFSLQLRREHARERRKLPDKFIVIPIYYAPRIVYLLHSVEALLDKNFYREISLLIQEKRFGWRQLISLFVFTSRAHYEKRRIEKSIEIKSFDKAVFYSYRFEYQPYVAMLLAKNLKNIKIVSRAHGYDLYEENRKEKYIPMRRLYLEKIGRVLPCSLYGERYLKEKFPEYASKITTSYLGTKDFGYHEYRRESVFRIVTCSTVVPVKRLHLIVEALAKINDIPIEWTHYGDGPLLSKVKDFSKILGKNISTVFYGSVKNEDILKAYQEKNYFLFLNVSASEGIPVSIMEAMSFGIPCIATDVGGTAEIVPKQDGGRLLASDFTPDELAKTIRMFCDMDEYTYIRERHDARIMWKEKFDSDQNYKEFSRWLAGL